MFSRMGTAGQAFLAALLVGGSLGYAFAQEAGDSTVDVIQVEPIRGPDDGRPLSPAAQAKAARSAMAGASASCAAQSRALKSAKREKDIIRATCLKDKLDQCNASLQSMKRRQAALDEAIASGDSGSRNHEFTVIGVLSQKFKALAQASNQCVGQDLFDTGETQVREDVDLFVPDEDPSVIVPVLDWPIPFIPPPVSGVT
ncbi:MAG: hypothetical protein HKN10_13880 [Myxococcales bacterium]|nr:hypothetical protein [Deltaproteobacteria bacterium]NNE19559.1 hypothetical protein [Myxococcales bacterium]